VSRIGAQGRAARLASALGERTRTPSMNPLLILFAIVLAAPIWVSAGVPSAPDYGDVPEREMSVPAIIKSDTKKLGMHDTVCMLLGSPAGLLLSISIEGDGPSHPDEITVVAHASDGTTLPLQRMWAVKTAKSDDYDFLYHLTIPHGPFLTAVSVRWGSDEVTLDMTHRKDHVEAETKTAQPDGAANRSQPIRTEPKQASVAAGSDR